MVLSDLVWAKIVNFFVRRGFMKYRWFIIWIAPHATGEVIAYYCTKKNAENCKLWHCPNHHSNKI